MPSDSPRTVNRSERILAFMSLTLVGASLLAILAIIAGTALGAGNDDGFSRGVWPIVIVLPLPGLTLGLALLIALLIVSWSRRARENRRSAR
jgi:hypothetical protein